MSDGQFNQTPPRRRPAKPRRGSERRRLQPRITFRLDEELQVKIDMDAAAEGLTVGSYLRSLAAATCRVRPRRRPLPGEVLLTQLKGEAGRVDGNLAQFLKLANRGEFVPPDELADSMRAVRDFYLKASAALARDF